MLPVGVIFAATTTEGATTFRPKFVGLADVGALAIVIEAIANNANAAKASNADLSKCRRAAVRVTGNFGLVSGSGWAGMVSATFISFPPMVVRTHQLVIKNELRPPTGQR